MNTDILRTLSYGMYAIGAKGEAGQTACIVNTVFQVASSPAIVAVSLHRNNYTNECIRKNGLFTVSVLSEDTSGTAIGVLGFTSGRNTDKLGNLRHKVLSEGVPVVKENICCWFLCRVTGSIEAETHTVFLAQIIAGSENYVGTPMTYGYYHQVIKGKAPKNAPTFLQNGLPSDLGESYVCTICGYVYNDSEKPFEDLPDDWVCPICGAPLSAFVRRD